MIREFLLDESGATAVEYGLIAALIAVAMVAGATAVGDQLNTKFDDTAGELDNAMIDAKANTAVNEM